MAYIRLILILFLLNNVFSQLPTFENHQWNYEVLDRLILLEKYNTAKFFADKNSAAYSDFAIHFPTQKLSLQIESKIPFIKAASAFNLLNSDAERLLEKTIKEHYELAESQKARFYLLILKFLKKRYNEAEKLTENIDEEILSQTEKEDLNFIKGYLAFRKNNYNKAVKYLEPLTLKLGRYHHPANYYVGIAYYNLGKYKKALEFFKTIEKIEPYSTKVPVFIASILLNLKAYDELLNYIEEIKNKNIEQKDKIYLFAANALFEKRQFRESLPYFEKYFSLTKDPDPAAIYRIGYVYIKNKQFNKAKKYLEKIAAREDTLGQASSYYLGFVYFFLKDYESSKLAFQRAYSMNLNKDFEKDALIQYARVAFHSQYYDEALEAFKTFLKKYPDDPRTKKVRELLAEAYFYSRKFPELINYLKNKKYKTPEEKIYFQKACLFYGLEFLESNNLDKALYYFKLGLNDFSKDENINLSLQFWYAETLFWKKDYKSSGQSYLTYLRAKGSKKHEYFFPAIVGLGWSYFKQNIYSVAFKYFSKTDNYPQLIEKNKLWYVESLVRRADCKFLQKQYLDAITYYKKALKEDFVYQDYILFQLGRSYKRLSNYPKSAKYFKELVEKYPTSTLREEALYKLADLYLVWIKDYPKAEKYAKILVKDYKKGKFAAEGYLIIAGAAYSSKDYQKAEKFFKHVIFEYGDDTVAAKAALEGLVNIIPPEKFDKIYEQYREKYPVKNILLEDLTFETARERFNQQNYTKAIDKLTKYLQDFPAGKYKSEAYLLRAKSYLAMKDTANAIKYFTTLTDSSQEWNDFTIEAAQELANIYIIQKNNDKVKELLLKVDSLTKDPYEKFHAEFNLAEIFMQEQNYDSAKIFINKILKDPNITEYSRTRANFNLARIDYEQGDTLKALQKFKHIAETNKKIFGAKSQYYLAKIYYELDSLDKSKQVIIDFKKKFPAYNYWKAKAFIILSEIYNKKGKKMQAKETLKSIIKLMQKYPDIIDEARAKLNEIENEDEK